MSKCDIEIEFYRPDREFRAGEKVQGWIRITVNKKLKCKGLHLNVFWKTHGRGNTTRKNYHQQNLFQGDWEVGETFEYSFEFDAPASPITYHGKYLNIDHYVSVRAEVPWALDPRREEEFLVRPGSVMAEVPESQPVIESGSSWGMYLGIAFGLGLVALALLFTLKTNLLFLLLLLPAVLILFLSLRSKLAISKLGQVEWTTKSHVHAGVAMPSTLNIGPLGNVDISKITMRVLGNESVVSGSGTNKTTYSHVVYDQTEIILENESHRSGETIQLQPNITFPETDAISVDLPDNRITWHATLAIRLVRWPDWVQTRSIQLLPGVGSTEPVENPNPAFDALTLQELIDVIQGLDSLGSDHAKIDQAIAENASMLFTVSIEIDEIESSGAEFEDPEYANGRTVAGKLIGTDYYISLQLPQRFNQQIDRLDRGHSWNGVGALIRWQPLTSQMTMLGI